LLIFHALEAYGDSTDDDDDNDGPPYDDDEDYDDGGRPILLMMMNNGLALQVVAQLPAGKGKNQIPCD